MKWEALPLADRARLMAAAVKNGYTDIRSIKEAYANFLNLKESTGNRFAEGGDTDDTYEPEVINPLDNLPEWKALENIDYVAIPDPEFTREKTGAGSIEYFPAEEPEGITYTNGYHRDHPMPGKDVILYNPNDNDELDIRLDALHIMPKDSTYDALNTIYRNASWDARDDNYINAINEYTTDKIKQAIRYTVDRTTGKDTNDRYYGTDPFMLYFNNEADGTLRSLLMEGDEDYRKSKRYWGDKDEVREWNAHLMPYVNDIQRYLETGERPPHVLPNLEVTNQNAYGGNLFDGVSGTSKMKKKSRSSAGGLNISDYQRKKAAYYRNELIKRGITNPVHLDAIIANMAVESSFNPGANDGTGAHGLMLWMGSRIPKDMSEKGLLDYIAKTYNHFGGNDWLNKEAYKRFNTTNDPVEAANLMRIYWERCAPLYHYRAGAWLNLYNNNGDKSTIGTYHPMLDITWDDVQARRKRFELTPQEEALLNSTPNTTFNVDYTNWDDPQNKETFEKFYEPFALDESLYKQDNLLDAWNGYMALQNLGNSPSQESNPLSLILNLRAISPKAVSDKRTMDAMDQFLAVTSGGFDGINFAAYGGKVNRFDDGGLYNDRFMDYYGYKWVPASQILMSDPYFKDIQKHNPNGYYAVDEEGYYIPASTLKQKWERYKSNPSINTPSTAIPLNEVVHTFNDNDQYAIDTAKKLWGDDRFYAYRDMSNRNSDFFYETFDQLDTDEPQHILTDFSPNELIARIDTLTLHSTTPKLVTNPFVTSFGEKMDSDGRLRAFTIPEAPGAPIFLDSRGMNFLTDYVSELAHTYQHRQSDNNLLGINLMGQNPSLPMIADNGKRYWLPYDKSYYIPGTDEYNAHTQIEPELRYYLTNQNSTYNDFVNSLKQQWFPDSVPAVLIDKKILQEQLRMAREQSERANSYTISPATIGGLYGSAINKFGDGGFKDQFANTYLGIGQFPDYDLDFISANNLQYLPYDQINFNGVDPKNIRITNQRNAVMDAWDDDNATYLADANGNLVTGPLLRQMTQDYIKDHYGTLLLKAFLSNPDKYWDEYNRYRTSAITFDENGNPISSGLPPIEKPIEPVAPEFWLLSAGASKAPSALNSVISPLFNMAAVDNVIDDVTPYSGWGNMMSQNVGGPEWAWDLAHPAFAKDIWNLTKAAGKYVYNRATKPNLALTSDGSNVTYETGVNIDSPYRFESNSDTVDLYKKMLQKEYYDFLRTGKMPETEYTLIDKDIVNSGYEETGLGEDVVNKLIHDTLGRRKIAHQSLSDSDRAYYEMNLLDHDMQNIENAAERIKNIRVGTYDANVFDRAGIDKDIQGMHFNEFGEDPSSIIIKLGEKDIPAIKRHEGEHEIDEIIELTPEQKKKLKNAYDQDFVGLPDRVPEDDALFGYENMEAERTTTNGDARDIVLKHHAGTTDIYLQNKIIDKTSDEKIFEAVEKANGYGRRYITWLREHNKLTHKKALEFREAMKIAGITGIVAGTIYPTSL